MTDNLLLLQANHNFLLNFGRPTQEKKELNMYLHKNYTDTLILTGSHLHCDAFTLRVDSRKSNCQKR